MRPNLQTYVPDTSDRYTSGVAAKQKLTAAEIDERLAALEPCDLQLEYRL